MPRVIVVFGTTVHSDGSPSGTLARRVRAAWLFGRGYADTRFLVSGGIGASGYPEWKVMRRLLVEACAAPENILAEPHGMDTLGQVRRCSAILRAHDLTDDVWIATSLYHQPRCWVLFRIFGIEARIVPAVPDRPALPVTKLIYFWAREVFALPIDIALAIATRGRSLDNS
jgi:vancomycin permeability regulator SanA